MEGYRWIDVSLPLSGGLPLWPGDEPFRLTVRTCQEGNYRVSSVSMSLHCGTHMDAPLHCLPGGRSVDDLPPQAVLGSARVVEYMGRDHIGLEDIRRVDPSEGDRILFKTMNSRFYETEEFRQDYVALTCEAARFLADRSIALVGIDYLSVEPWDGDGEVHRILAEAGIWILEGLDLRGVTPGKYLLLCLPLRLVGAEASPVRALLGKRVG